MVIMGRPHEFHEILHECCMKRECIYIKRDCVEGLRPPGPFPPLFAVRVRGVMHPEALAKPTLMKQWISQTRGSGVYVVITHVTCSDGACMHGYGASSVWILRMSWPGWTLILHFVHSALSI